MMIKFHGIPLSVHARKPILAALYKDIDYIVEPVVPFNPPANWADLSPTGLIPVMEDDALALPDSSAICHYLDRRFPAQPILPSDAVDYARTLWFDAYAGNLFRDVIHPLFHQKVLGPKVLGQATDETVVGEILQGRVPRYFGYLDGEAKGAFLVAGRLTLADIAIGSNLINFQYLGLRIDAEQYPNLARYVRDLIGLPAFQTALGHEQPFADQMQLDRTFLA